MSITPLVEVKPNPSIPLLAPGDTVKVNSKVVEGDRERIQVFQGVVIKVRRGGVGANFTWAGDNTGQESITLAISLVSSTAG